MSPAIAAPTAAQPALVKYAVVNGGIPVSLTGVPGDPARGKAVVLDRKLGNCAACHRIPLDAPFQGSLGPDLSGVAARLSVPQLRLRIVDADAINPATIMPAYYRVAGINDVAAAFRGKPILDAEQVEDVVSYLATLR